MGDKLAYIPQAVAHSSEDFSLCIFGPIVGTHASKALHLASTKLASL